MRYSRKKQKVISGNPPISPFAKGGRREIAYRLPLTAFKKYPVFYQKVWLACAQIPKGQRRSYGWIAKKIGNPMASRAVGRALAENPFAPEIPCHRVVRSDGSIGGYSGSGGIKRKKFLLKMEHRGATLKKE